MKEQHWGESLKHKGQKFAVCPRPWTKLLCFTGESGEQSISLDYAVHTCDIKDKPVLRTGLTLWERMTHLWGFFSPWTRDGSGKLLKHKGIFAFLSFPRFCLTNTRNCENTMLLYWLKAPWGYRWGKASTCLLRTPLHCSTVNARKAESESQALSFTSDFSHFKPLSTLQNRAPFWFFLRANHRNPWIGCETERK